MQRDLFNLRGLKVSEVTGILQRAQYFKDGGTSRHTDGKVACNLFFEPSTRTQYSFNMAEIKLGMRVISFSPENSSLKKAESFYDTIKTFDSFLPDVMVIRYKNNNFYLELEGHMQAAIISGGDGTGDHPTQSLLDLLTIWQEFGRFEGLKAAIIGDIKHSRVARTDHEIMRRLGMEVVVSGPLQYMEAGFLAVDFEEAIRTADVVMLLRIQHERHEGDEWAEERLKREYHQKYGLNEQNIGMLKPNAIIMHPAPINRGMEMSDGMVEHRQSRIFKQMQNGVFVRMAALERAITGEIE